MSFKGKHGVYVLKLWVLDNPAGNAPHSPIKQGALKEKGRSKAAGFPRPGR